MVDFQSDATVTTPPTDLLKILTLQRRNDVIEAVEFAKDKEYNGIQGGEVPVRKRMVGLYLEIRDMLKQRMENKEFSEIMKVIDSGSWEELFNLVCKFSEVLYDMNLIRIDQKRVYDSTKTAQEDKVKGL